MTITFDAAKNQVNLVKHGVSLTQAENVEWDTAVIWPDTRNEYGEPRHIALAYIGQRLFSVVFVDRADGRRIISLRKANLREVKRYAET